MRINVTIENLLVTPNVASVDAEVTLIVDWYPGDEECAGYAEVRDWRVTLLVKYDDRGVEVATYQMCALEEERRDEVNAAIAKWINDNESLIAERASEKFVHDDEAARDAYYDAKFEQSRGG